MGRHERMLIGVPVLVLLIAALAGAQIRNGWLTIGVLAALFLAGGLAEVWLAKRGRR